MNRVDQPERPFPLFAATYTPLAQDGSLQLGQVAQLADLLAAEPVDGAFIAGTTGEGSSLTVEERQSLAEAWMGAAPQRGLEVIVHVGHNCQRDAMRLAAHAERLGADAVAAHAPGYLRPRRVEQLIDFLEPIAGAASDTPFYYYHIPSLTGVSLPPHQLLKQAKKRLPNLIGLKFSDTDLIELQRCVALEEGGFHVLFGCDEMLLAAVSLGAHGAVGSTYNLCPAVYRQMLRAVQEADMHQARKLQLESVHLVEVLKAYDPIAAGKALMAWCGVDCGPPRPPLCSLGPSEKVALRAEWEALGMRSSAEREAKGLEIS